MREKPNAYQNCHLDYYTRNTSHCHGAERMLTLAYVTNRKEPCIEWWFRSLDRELNGDYTGVQIVVVDFWAEEPRPHCFAQLCRHDIWHVAPKPTPWQGPHRLTKENWFAAANQRNTALCLAPDGWIAYCDDLSVLLPGWLSRVQRAIKGNYLVFGAYKKMRGMVVENGAVKSATEHAADNRLKQCSDVTPCGGNWLYGCSLAAPVDALLSVNGWPEDLCDGLGFEDCCMGIALKNAGHDLRYDPHMMTYESEELHYVEPAFRKEDWHFRGGLPVKGGSGGDDKSHAALNIAMQSKWFPNSVGNMREVRQKVLEGEPFPVNQNPRHDWFTKVPLGEL